MDALNGVADFANKIGVYEVTETGAITDIRVMFQNVQTVAAGDAFRVEGVEAGHRLGFFLVQDGANRLGEVADADLGFVFNEAGAAELQLAGADAGATTFHSFDAAWNTDGVAHALSGASADGSALRVGLEDLDGWGDQDFEDFVFNLARVDMIA